MIRVLLIEDDIDAAQEVQRAFGDMGWQCDVASDGEQGLKRAQAQPYDVLVVDRMLPKRDGLSVVSALRSGGLDTPVLFLTALGEVEDRVEGLKAGGDDYLIKPYALSELSARIEVLARRRPMGEGAPTRLKTGELDLDLLKRTATRAGKKLDLQPREFKLLEFFMRHAGQTVTRTMLLEQVWGYHFDPQTNVIDVHVSRLRAKIDKDFDQPLLHTVRGAGYRLDA
jgi:two-component system OmpR family response regulator